MTAIVPPTFRFPGHASAEELLSFIAPSTHSASQLLSVGAVTAVTVVAPPSRKTIIIQPYSDVWLNIGAPAVANQCLKLQAFSMIGIDLFPNVDVSLLSAAGTVSVFVVQLAQQPS